MGKTEEQVVLEPQESWSKWGIYLLIGLAIILTANARLNGNLVLLFASVFHTDHLGDFPNNVYLSYGRGIGYKMLLYSLYQAYQLFYDTFQVDQFNRFVIIVYYSVALSFSGICWYVLKPALARAKLDWKLLYLLFTLLLLLATHRQVMEAPEVCFFLTLGLYACAYSESKVVNYCAGILVPLLFSIKGITLLFAGFPFFTLIYTEREDRTKLIRFFVSGLVWCIIGALVYWLVLPLEIENYMAQTLYQKAFALKATSVLLFGLNWLKTLSCIPSNTLALILSLVIFAQCLRQKNYKDVGFLFLFGLIPVVYVVLQHKWLPYNYLILFPLSILLIIFLLANYQQAFAKRWLQVSIGASIVVYVSCYWLPLYQYTSLARPYCNYCNYKTNYYEKDQHIYQSLDEKYGLTGTTVLAINSGYSGYYVRYQSYLKQPNPLPLQRSATNEGLKDTYMYKDMLEKVLDYEGRYILIENGWMQLDAVPELVDKLKTEYQLMEQYPIYNNSTVELYQRK